MNAYSIDSMRAVYGFFAVSYAVVRSGFRMLSMRIVAPVGMVRPLNTGALRGARRRDLCPDSRLEESYPPVEK